MFDLMKKYRSGLMGVAILWVILYHLNFTPTFAPLLLLKSCGYGGVDIFMLCTGFGVAHSLHKNGRFTAFYKKRCQRILPGYFIFIAFYLLLTSLIRKSADYTELLGNITLTGWWLNRPNQFNWYVQALPLYYLLSPIIYTYLTNKKERLLQRFWLIILLELFVSVACFKTTQLMAISRFPLLTVGMLFGIAECEKINFRPKRFYLLTALATVVGFAALFFTFKTGKPFDFKAAYGLHWYPFLLITPGLSLLICAALGLLEKLKLKPVVTAFSALGNASFAIYLIHIGIIDILNLSGLYSRFPALPISLLIIVVAVITGLVLNKAKALLSGRKTEKS